jgi:hypothetical protein
MNNRVIVTETSSGRFNAIGTYADGQHELYQSTNLQKTVDYAATWGERTEMRTVWGGLEKVEVWWIPAFDDNSYLLATYTWN